MGISKAILGQARSSNISASLLTDTICHSTTRKRRKRRSLDAIPKDGDRMEWGDKGKLSPISMALKKGDVGFNSPKFKSTYMGRKEQEWPIARTKYVNTIGALMTYWRLLPLSSTRRWKNRVRSAWEDEGT